MLQALQQKSYADEDFVVLKEKFGDIFDFSLTAAKRLNQIAQVLRTWYDKQFDIRVKTVSDDQRTNSIKLVPYIVVYYPKLVINNGKKRWTINDLFVIYELNILTTNIMISSNVRLCRSTYTTKELIQRYTHSHVSSSVEVYYENGLKRKLHSTVPHIVDFMDVSESLCLGTDNIKHVISDLSSQNDDTVDKLFTYFFGYMDSLLTFENVSGAYGGMLIEKVSNVVFNDEKFIRSTIDYCRFWDIDVFNIQNLMEHIFPYIEQVVFDGKMLRILSFTNTIATKLEELFGSTIYIYELDRVFYRINPQRSSARFTEVRYLVSEYAKLTTPVKIGVRFRNEFIPYKLIDDLPNETTTSTSMYKKVIHPEFINTLTTILNHQLNTKYHAAVFNKSIHPPFFQNNN